MSEEQIDRLLKYDIDRKINAARNKVEDFDNLPEYLQLKIVDGFFRGDLSKSPNTLKLMNKGDWAGAAEEYLNHKEYDDSKFIAYKLVYANGEIWSVPLDEDNRHYQEILEWVADGNTIEEPA